MKGKKGRQSNSNFDVVSLSNGVSSLTQVRLLTPFLTLYGPNSFFRRFSGHNLR